MTLIIAMGNERQVVMVSDRRLSSNGLLVDDESNKAVIISTQNARLALGFTGLARCKYLETNRWNQFETNRWLPRALLEASEIDSDTPMFDRLAKIATKKLATLNIRDKKQARLSLAFAGYLYRDDPPRILIMLISNFEKLDGSQSLAEANEQFEVSAIIERKITDLPRTLFYAVGANNLIPPGDKQQLEKMLELDKPAGAIVNKGVETIRSVATTPASHGSVGKQCSSIILPRNQHELAMSDYHSFYKKAVAHMVTYVDCRHAPFSRGIIESRDVRLREATGDPAHFVLPPVGRNEPCPCGSGKRYKLCHALYKRAIIRFSLRRDGTAN